MIMTLTALEYTWIRTALKEAPPMLTNDPNMDSEAARKEMLHAMSIRTVVNTGLFGHKKMLQFDVYPPDGIPMSAAAHWYADNGPLTEDESKMLHKSACRILDSVCNPKKPAYVDGYNRPEPNPHRLADHER